MNRKQFLALAPAALAAGTILPRLALAQEASAFRTLGKLVPTDAAKGQIEVIEFMWFGCPHCFALEPVIEEWSQKLPKDVVFSRQHVLFQVRSHQQLYFTLEAMNQTGNKVMMGVFNAIHQKKLRFMEQKEIVAELATLGVDTKAFEAAWGSFGVRTRMKRADTLMEQYGVESVPTLGVNGQYVTSPAMAGGNPQALQVVDSLIERIRKAG